MRIPIPGSRARISMAARRPSSVWSGGICTSTIATSGRWAATLRRRSSASPAWATTSKPASDSRRLSPSRRSTWSSPTTTRTAVTRRTLPRAGWGRANRTSPVGRTACAGERARSNGPPTRAILLMTLTRQRQRTEDTTMNQPEPQHQIEQPRSRSVGMSIVRYGLGAVMVIGGVVMLIISPAGLGFDGFGMAVGGGLSVVLFNVLFRLGLSSEADRAQEERARDYFD